MRSGNKKITIIQTNRYHTSDINEELQWFGASLGLFNLRDKDKSCFRIFIEIIRASKVNHPIKSDELAKRLNLTRGTIVHHLNKLIDAGIVTTIGNKYRLRSANLTFLIDEIGKDAKRILGDLRSEAIKIDRMLGL